MIITRTPLRISFLGGGSDFPACYEQQEGLVLGATIQKYIYINVNEKFDQDVRVSYSKAEIVENSKLIKHDIARQVLLDYDIQNHFEISSMSDVPSNGTGMGSSSSYCAGLLKAVHYYKTGKILEDKILAEKTCQLEIEKLGKPIGKQDQYFAVYGGLISIRFSKKEISVKRINCKTKTYDALQKNLFLVYTGINRSADDILSVQEKNTRTNAQTKEAIGKIVDMAKLLEKDILEDNLSNFGALLDEAWKLKKKYAENISNPKIDDLYLFGKKNGASGGKLLGAGGGGFILFYVSESEQERFLNNMNAFKVLPVRFSHTGSEIIFKQ